MHLVNSGELILKDCRLCCRKFWRQSVMEKHYASCAHTKRCTKYQTLFADEIITVESSNSFDKEKYTRKFKKYYKKMKHELTSKIEELQQQIVDIQNNESSPAQYELAIKELQQQLNDVQIREYAKQQKMSEQYELIIEELQNKINENQTNELLQKEFISAQYELIIEELQQQSQPKRQELSMCENISELSIVPQIP